MGNDYSTALAIATRAHSGQTRKDGEDYINHPRRIAARMWNEYNDIELECIAIMHDVIEDSAYTIADIKAVGFTNTVVDALRILTREIGQSYLDYILDIKDSGSRDAMLVKLADLEDNLNGAKGTLKDKYEMARYILTHYED